MTVTPLIVRCPACVDTITIPLHVAEAHVVKGHLAVTIGSDMSDLHAHVARHVEALVIDGSSTAPAPPG